MQELLSNRIPKLKDKLRNPAIWKTQGDNGSLDRARYNTLGCIKKGLEFGNEAQYLIRS
jgi:hypothetical protein